MNQVADVTHFQLALFVIGGFCSAALIPDDIMKKLRLPGGLVLLGSILYILYKL
jgi:hypothetical protein